MFGRDTFPYGNPFPFGPTLLSGEVELPPSYFGADLWADWDFSDPANLYTDSGRTTPVTADLDPIGSCTDLSGNLRHLAQGTAAARPTWRSVLYGAGSAKFDKTNDFLLRGTAVGTNYEIFVSLTVVRASFPGPITVDIALTSGASGAGAYDHDTYSSAGTVNNNRVAQRRSTHYYVNAQPFVNGSSIGTTQVNVVFSSNKDGTATSNLGYYVGAMSDSTQFGNQAIKRICVISRATTDAETIGLHNYLMNRW